jgi:hypothetical protein
LVLQSRPAPPRRIDLAAVEASLWEVQQAFPGLNQKLRSPREPMSDEVVRNMVAGYGFVDRLITEGTDLFALGNSELMVALNHLVLCGDGWQGDPEFRPHREATEAYFYEQREGGIGDLMQWYALHERNGAWKLAAGVYVHVLSEPQLYIEGNHRTGALLASFLLTRAGQPPFVLTVDNARGYFDPSTLIKKTKKHAVTTLFRLPKIRREVAGFLERQADERFLLP